MREPARQPAPQPRPAHRRDHPAPPRRTGRGYYLRKIADGKTKKEARRCLKRRISDAIYRQLVADAQSKRAGPGRADGGDYEDQRGRPTPDGRLFDQATTRAPPNATPAAAKAS